MPVDLSLLQLQAFTGKCWEVHIPTISMFQNVQVSYLSGVEVVNIWSLSVLHVHGSCPLLYQYLSRLVLT